MKQLSFYCNFFILALLLTVCTHLKSSNIGSGETISINELLKSPEFLKEYHRYQPDNNEINNFKRLSNNKFTVFFGLWCHDSQREVPRLLKLIKLAQMSSNAIKLITINQQKQIPLQYQEKYQVELTPTIFMEKNEKILATLVEKPKDSISKDLLKQIKQLD